MIDNYYFNNDNKNNNIDIYFFTSTFPQPRYPGFGRVQKRPKTEGMPEYSWHDASGKFWPMILPDMA